MQNKVFSVLNYVGHKSKIIEIIDQHLPKIINGVFWDMFSGSGVVGLSIDHPNVQFVDNNIHLQHFMQNLSDQDFIKQTETILTNYGFTNSSRTQRSELLKDPNIGTCTWHGKTVSNMHLDALNKAPYSSLLKDYNAGKFSNLEKACCYYILTIYGRNSYVSVNKSGGLSGGVGPLDFGPMAKKKVKKYQEIIKLKNCNFYLGKYSDFAPTANDFVYMDPPYLASGFSYGGWTDSDEEQLLEWIDNLPCDWALSNVFISGKKSNDILQNWAKKKNVIYINKTYRKWASKGKSSATKKTKKSQEVLILP